MKRANTANADETANNSPNLYAAYETEDSDLIDSVKLSGNASPLRRIAEANQRRGRARHERGESVYYGREREDGVQKSVQHLDSTSSQARYRGTFLVCFGGGDRMHETQSACARRSISPTQINASCELQVAYRTSTRKAVHRKQFGVPHLRAQGEAAHTSRTM
jgi:hypothetical protein